MKISGVLGGSEKKSTAGFVSSTMPRRYFCRNYPSCRAAFKHVAYTCDIMQLKREAFEERGENVWLNA